MPTTTDRRPLTGHPAPRAEARREAAAEVLDSIRERGCSDIGADLNRREKIHRRLRLAMLANADGDKDAERDAALAEIDGLIQEANDNGNDAATQEG